MKTNVPENNSLKALGDKIRTLRKAQGLSQAQLAGSTGMTTRYLGGVEAGKHNISFEYLEALAERLSIPLTELFDSEDQEAKAAVLRELTSFLKKQPLSQLLFIRRALRMLKQ